MEGRDVYKRQIREGTAYAEKNGITIVKHYIDRAISAKTDNPFSISFPHKKSVSGSAFIPVSYTHLVTGDGAIAIVVDKIFRKDK